VDFNPGNSVGRLMIMISPTNPEINIYDSSGTNHQISPSMPTTTAGTWYHHAIAVTRGVHDIRKTIFYIDIAKYRSFFDISIWRKKGRYIDINIEKIKTIFLFFCDKFIIIFIEKMSLKFVYKIFFVTQK
jgi:hypothetical protein